MSERDNQNHWRDLADELGLPPEEFAPEPKSSEAKPPVTEIRAPSAQEADWVEELTPPPPRLASEPLPTEPIDLPAITSLDPPTLDPMQEPAERETFFEDPQAAREPERPRGRGGRRGRGRRGRGDRNDGPPPARREAPREEAPPFQEPAAEQDAPREERGRRGRRPPDRRPEPEREQPDLDEEMGDLEPEEIESAIPAEEEDDGPEDTLDDLNVPSWPDLIASLYRPDR